MKDANRKILRDIIHRHCEIYNN